MPDDKSKRGPADATRVNIHENYEVEYWTKKFGCTKAKLVAAVKAKGVMAVDVKAWLEKNK
jgi:Protein of unknown function (DUF3606)